MSNSPIDMSVFTELQEATGADFVGELVETFCDEASVMRGDLNDAAAQDDADGFRRAAHSIKSNANIFGAHVLASVAREMELTGLSDDPQERQSRLDELSAEMDRAVVALKGFLNG